jgi:hypothetical protein
MKTSEQINEIAAAMIVFHTEVNSIPKTANNPFFKSKYVPLDKILSAIQEPLKKANLAFMQFPVEENQLETIILHTSGQWIAERFYMRPTKADPQAYGSVITYQRRYALSAILGLNTDEDDDGNKASATKEKIDDGVRIHPNQPSLTKPEILPETEQWTKAVEYLKVDGNKLDAITKHYSISEENKQKLLEDAL